MQINQATFTAIVESAKAKAANDPKWLRAIEKAAAGFESWIITEHFDHIMVTTESGNTYRVNGHCSCRAGVLGRPCKHLAMRRLLEIAAGLPQVVAPKAATSREDLIAEIKSTFAAKFPGYRLAETVQRL